MPNFTGKSGGGPSAMKMYGKGKNPITMSKNPVKKVDEFEKIPSKPAPKGIDVHSKVSGLMLESNGKNVRQSMNIAGRTFVNKRNNKERTRDYIAKNQPKAVVPKDMPEGKKKRRTKRFEKKAMKS